MTAAAPAAGCEQDTSTTRLPLLADPAGYSPHTFDYYTNTSRDPARPVGLPQWLEVFRKSIPTFRSHCLTDASVPAARREQAAERFASAFGACLDALVAAPHAALPGYAAQPISCFSLCAVREQCLREAGFSDIFLSVKQAENEAALALLPQVLQQLDAQPDASAAMELALRGVFAGNIFDLGAAASAERYESGQGAGFHCALDELLPRPWAVDDLEEVLEAFAASPYRKAVLFVDNAGADVLLGMVPFARELLKAGTQVILAANSGPSINDITAAELRPLLQRAGAVDATLAAALASGRLAVLENGSGMPVIDLSQIAPELAAASADADLVVLEGMGRGIETNLCAAFTCDALRLGMIKHPEVAACLGGRLYDCVCCFSRAGQGGLARGGGLN